MQVAICDDDKAARAQVGELVTEKMRKRHEPLKITYSECGEDLIEAYESGKQRFDLIFLDIYMRYMGGIETAKKLRLHARKAAVMFLTSSLDFALESYAVHACDYLIKPVSKERFTEALNHFLETFYPRVRQSLSMINGSAGRRIAYDDILYIESHRMNLRIVCQGGPESTVRKKLEEVQEELPKKRFLRCNQSFIVNMDYIVEADKDFTMANGERIPIKVREKNQIRKQYFNYLLESGWEA